ncbi:heavy metal translocating P-type ATPase [Chitinophaga polysaccharea]|uniref:heavy metal translocating P-type ATPase n=1 Tax=Chitinophaga polysaccharea TaxID=1293035 RepID=UPI001454FB9B|nr:heavy metal translocating P-type ATPase [Chitinophaga polysaccharea]NLR60455.1 heavy metal translocating P-type ATPase [Chitinophaga polysaccharea]
MDTATPTSKIAPVRLPEAANHNAHGDHTGMETQHAHGGLFGKHSELIFSLLCGALLGTGFGLSYLDLAPSSVSLGLYIGAYFFGGFYTVKEAVQTIAKGKFEIDFLMLVAAGGAGILGSWAEGALLLFLFSLGHALEHFAMERAKKSIAALSELAPRTAFRKENGSTREVPITDLSPGDVIVVKPNTKISADGIVVKGNSSVNQAPITGESMPVDKKAIADPEIAVDMAASIDAAYKVFAGTINGNELLEVKVTKAASDSTLSRLIRLVNETQSQKSPTQLFTDRFEKYFVPAVILIVTLLCFAFLVLDEPFSKSFYRAMSVLVAASPCALAISTPSAVLSGVARAARAGVLIKGGGPLEDLGALEVLAFDKTGTLTEGRPKLTKIIPLAGMTENDLLKIVVAVESLSDHPLAKAISKGGRERLKNESIPSAHDLEAVLGKGIKASLGADDVYMGNIALFQSLDHEQPNEAIATQVTASEKEGNTTMLVRRNQEYIGIIAVMDTPRAEAKQALAELKAAGIRRMAMLTGDNEEVAKAVAAEVGVTDVYASLLPEQKVTVIQQLTKDESKIAMVGDGVNDAPAMAKSTVGIAMGAAGSDVALETADIALMGDKLSLLPFAIGLSRKARKIIRQNLVISLSVVAILIPLTILGIASIGPAVIAHEGSTLVVVFNALRLLAYKWGQK